MKYSFTNPRRQNFSLPPTVMKYIEDNFTPRVYMKLQHTCKYFFATHQLIPLDSVHVFDDIYYDEPAKEGFATNEIYSFDPETKSLSCQRLGEKTIDLTKAKLWLWDDFEWLTSTWIDSFLDLVYRWDVKWLSIKGQHLYKRDFEKLRPNNLQNVKLLRTKIVGDSRFDMSFDEVLKFLPNIQSLDYRPPRNQTYDLTKDDVEALPIMKSLTSLDIYNIDGDTDFSAFEHLIRTRLPSLKWCSIIMRKGAYSNEDLKNIKKRLKALIPNSVAVAHSSTYWYVQSRNKSKTPKFELYS